MTTHIDATSAPVPCHVCGYDLRAQPQDGRCPECAASVAESQRIAAIPLRPAWRDSDPRWRRRMLTGAWVLVFLPLMDLVNAMDWSASIPMPNVFGSHEAVTTLDDTFVSRMDVYPPLVFCIGIVLLFSKERGRRRNRLDWTRRWGVLCSYVVLLLSAAPVLFISALVAVGIAALFLSMPPKYQPASTQWFIEGGAAYLRYGPYPSNLALVALLAFASVAVLLACVALYDALCSSGPQRLAMIVLAPLALFALVHLAQVVRYVHSYRTLPFDAYPGVYFWPELLVGPIAGLPDNSNVPGSTVSAFPVEAVKWCTVLAIAMWLTIGQVATWRRRKAPGDKTQDSNKHQVPATATDSKPAV